MIAPGLHNLVPGQVHYLESLIEKRQENRFNGSVNAVYYGAYRLIADEVQLAPIAACI